MAARAERVSEWQAIVAAMVYFATLAALLYGLFSLWRGGSFLDAALFVFPRALVLAVSFFLGAAAVEIVRTLRAKFSRARPRIAIHS